MPMIEELRAFLLDESGGELLEWAVVTIVVLSATALILVAIGDELTRAFNRILSELQASGGV